jgi:hypothetical protein
VAFDTKLLLANFHSFIDLTRHVELRLVSLLMSLERDIREGRTNEQRVLSIDIEAPAPSEAVG